MAWLGAIEKMEDEVFKRVTGSYLKPMNLSKSKFSWVHGRYDNGMKGNLLWIRAHIQR